MKYLEEIQASCHERKLASKLAGKFADDQKKKVKTLIDLHVKSGIQLLEHIVLRPTTVTILHPLTGRKVVDACVKYSKEIVRYPYVPEESVHVFWDGGSPSAAKVVFPASSLPSYLKAFIRESLNATAARCRLPSELSPPQTRVWRVTLGAIITLINEIPEPPKGAAEHIKEVEGYIREIVDTF